jgi:hypothetical protein
MSIERSLERQPERIEFARQQRKQANEFTHDAIPRLWVRWYFSIVRLPYIMSLRSAIKSVTLALLHSRVTCLGVLLNPLTPQDSKRLNRHDPICRTTSCPLFLW